MATDNELDRSHPVSHTAPGDGPTDVSMARPSLRIFITLVTSSEHSRSPNDYRAVLIATTCTSSVASLHESFNEQRIFTKADVASRRADEVHESAYTFHELHPCHRPPTLTSTGNRVHAV